jgi:hypothetical protein
MYPTVRCLNGYTHIQMTESWLILLDANLKINEMKLEQICLKLTYFTTCLLMSTGHLPKLQLQLHMRSDPYFLIKSLKCYLINFLE